MHEQQIQARKYIEKKRKIKLTMRKECLKINKEGKRSKAKHMASVWIVENQWVELNRTKKSLQIWPSIKTFIQDTADPQN